MNRKKQRLDAYAWVKKAIFSCTTIVQVRQPISRLIYFFEAMYPEDAEAGENLRIYRNRHQDKNIVKFK